jgi:hypothetical protein
MSSNNRRNQFASQATYSPRRAEVTVYCPQGHLLQLLPDSKSWTCDGLFCGFTADTRLGTLRTGSQRHGCRNCNYDLCDKCHDATTTLIDHRHVCSASSHTCPRVGIPAKSLETMTKGFACGCVQAFQDAKEGMAGKRVRSLEEQQTKSLSTVLDLISVPPSSTSRLRSWAKVIMSNLFQSSASTLFDGGKVVLKLTVNAQLFMMSLQTIIADDKAFPLIALDEVVTNFAENLHTAFTSLSSERSHAASFLSNHLNYHVQV